MAKIPEGHPRGEEARYFDELRDGRIVFQHCEDCGAAVWYLRTVCPNCMSLDLSLRHSAGEGVVHSLTTLHRPGHPARSGDVPYTVALVDLDDGVRVIGNLRQDATTTGIGGRVIA